MMDDRPRLNLATQIFSTTSAPVIFLDARRKIIWANETFEKVALDQNL